MNAAITRHADEFHPGTLLEEAASADAKAEELLAAYAEGPSGSDAGAIAEANANWDSAAEHAALAPRQMTTFILLSDVTAVDGPTKLVPLKYTKDLPLTPRELFGWPPPDSEYWNEQTLANVYDVFQVHNLQVDYS